MDGGGRIHVVAHDEDRPADMLDGGEVGEGNHLAGAVAHLELLDVVDLLAKRVEGLDIDLPGAAKAVEVVDVIGAESRLQSRANVVNGYAAVFRLGAIDEQFEPRRVGAEAREQALEAG